MSTELWAESPHYIGTPIVVETSTGDAEQMSEITEQLIALIRARDAAGLAKYGVTLDRKDLTIEQWLMHQAQELGDGAGYALAAMREVAELKAKLDKAVEALRPFVEHSGDLSWWEQWGGEVYDNARTTLAAIRETK